MAGQRVRTEYWDIKGITLHEIEKAVTAYYREIVIDLGNDEKAVITLWADDRKDLILTRKGI